MLKLIRVSIVGLAMTASLAIGQEDPATLNVPISPILECVETSEDFVYTAYFGYLNENNDTIDVPIGEANAFNRTEINQRQPTEFAPGRQRCDFSVVFDGSDLIWTLDSPDDEEGPLTATASSAMLACPSSENIMLGECDTGVPDAILVGEGSCTASELIANECNNGKNHGAFVSCVAATAKFLADNEYIAKNQKGKIVRCAAKSKKKKPKDRDEEAETSSENTKNNKNKNKKP